MADDLFHDPSLTNLSAADQRVIVEMAQRLSALEALSGKSPDELDNALRDAQAEAANERAAMLATFQSSVGSAIDTAATDLASVEDRIVRRLLAALGHAPQPIDGAVTPTGEPVVPPPFVTDANVQPPTTPDQPPPTTPDTTTPTIAQPTTPSERSPQPPGPVDLGPTRAGGV